MNPVHICLVVAMSENRVIGRDGGLPWKIPEDLKHFKAVTMGKPVIMGRRTYESIGKPLPGRANIVVSRIKAIPGVVVQRDFNEALMYARTEAVNADRKEIMVIGGGQIYEQALPVADRLYLTIVHREVEGDTFFPAYDKNEWRETARDDRDGFSFVTLDRA